MKFILKWILVLFILFVGWLGVMYTFQTKIIFPSPKEHINHPIPGALEWEDVSIQTTDNITLHGWWMDMGAEETVVFFHGNSTNISYYSGRLYMLKKLEKNALFFDYRGYGKSEGRVVREEDVYTDGQAAIDFLTQEKNIDPKKITLWGFSVGTGIATEMALRNPVSKLILEAPFLSVSALAYEFVPLHLPNWYWRYKFDNQSKIANITVPLLLLHSPEDKNVPYEQGQILFEKATTEKEFVELSGNHDNAISKSAAVYFSALKEFLP
jgi:uncharacterized protein